VFITVVVQVCGSHGGVKGKIITNFVGHARFSTFFPSYKSQTILLFEEFITRTIKNLALWLIYGVTSISDYITLYGRMTVVWDTTPRVAREKYMVMSTAGLGTKNDCAGEDQQQLTRSDPIDK
jgi:hypothetical protein